MFFFFKQKTAYELRISDWSSDVCSSDLNSLTRQIETFAPITPGRVRVYSCGPTVYNYAHLGNLRAYVFTDTLRRTLMWKGYDVTHIINITDVGHLTSDADAGDDKMEAADRKSVV